MQDAYLVFRLLGNLFLESYVKSLKRKGNYKGLVQVLSPLEASLGAARTELLIRSHFRTGNSKAAFETFKRRKDTSLVSLSAYHLLLSNSESFNKAKHIYDTMVNRHRFKPTILTFTLLLKLAKSWKQVSAVQEKLLHLNIEPNLVYYTMLISRLLKHRDSKHAMLHVSALMRRSDIQPDQVFYGALLKSLSLLGMEDLFRKGIKLMTDREISPNNHIYAVFLLR